MNTRSTLPLLILLASGVSLPMASASAFESVLAEMSDLQLLTSQDLQSNLDLYTKRVRGIAADAETAQRLPHRKAFLQKVILARVSRLEDSYARQTVHFGVSILPLLSSDAEAKLLSARTALTQTRKAAESGDFAHVQNLAHQFVRASATQSK